MKEKKLLRNNFGTNRCSEKNHNITLTDLGYHVERRRDVISTYINVESTLSVFWVVAAFRTLVKKEISTHVFQQKRPPMEVRCWDVFYSCSRKFKVKSFIEKNLQWSLPFFPLLEKKDLIIFVFPLILWKISRIAFL